MRLQDVSRSSYVGPRVVPSTGVPRGIDKPDAVRQLLAAEEGIRGSSFANIVGATCPAAWRRRPVQGTLRAGEPRSPLPRRRCCAQRALRWRDPRGSGSAGAPTWCWGACRADKLAAARRAGEGRGDPPPGDRLILQTFRKHLHATVRFVSPVLLRARRRRRTSAPPWGWPGSAGSCVTGLRVTFQSNR